VLCAYTQMTFPKRTDYHPYHPPSNAGPGFARIPFPSRIPAPDPVPPFYRAFLFSFAFNLSYLCPGLFLLFPFIGSPLVSTPRTPSACGDRRRFMLQFFDLLLLSVFFRSRPAMLALPSPFFLSFSSPLHSYEIYGSQGNRKKLVSYVVRVPHTLSPSSVWNVE